MSKPVPALLVTLFGTVLAGCNTTRGIGQDIEATGEVIEEPADDAKEHLRND